MEQSNQQREKIYIGRKDTLPLSEKSKIPLPPTSVQLALTEACPMRCVQCNLWMTHNQHLELPTEKWQEVIDDLGTWLPHKQIHFTGGEPFLRRDFLPLVRYAALERGLVVSANTSGGLIRESVLEQIKDSGINGLIFSLDAVGELHGKLRGHSQVFENNLKWIEALRHHLFVTIATVIMKDNLEHLVKLVDLAVDVGAAGIAFQPLFQNFGADSDPDWYQTSPIWPDNPHRVAAVIEGIIDKKREGYPVLNTYQQLELYQKYFYSPVEIHEYQCLVGETNLAVSPYGEVRLCYNMPPIGNVKQNLPSQLWLSQSAAHRREIINGCHRSCSIMNCNYNEV